MSTVDLPMIAYRLDDAARACGVNLKHIRRAIHRGELTPRQMVGSCMSVIPGSELQAWILAQPPTPPREQRNFKRKPKETDPCL